MNNGMQMRRRIPELRSDAAWFDDAKLGIMYSWGLYSVPGWAPTDPRLVEHFAGRTQSLESPWAHMSPLATSSYAEWYQNSMNLVGSPTWFYHQARWAGRTYESFRQEFEAATESVDLSSWAELARAAGAKYLLPLAKHHDGYLLYPSEVSSPYRHGFHSPRDVIGELKSHTIAAGLRFGVYYSGGLDWTAAGLPIAHNEDMLGDREARTERFWPERYARLANAHLREVIDRYEPAVLWNDIGYPDRGDARGIIAHLRSVVPDAVVNDRFDHEDYDFDSPEYKPNFDSDRKWELCRGIGMSFGYNRNEGSEHALTGREAIDLLISVVSRGGNLLFGVGPDDTGAISAEQQRPLRELGSWLDINGAAIYDTAPLADPPQIADVRFTATTERVFALTERSRIDLDLGVSQVRALDPRIRAHLTEGTLVIDNPTGAVAAIELS
ncbi:alpha-L-fucosidase [Microbacterium sp. NPDC090281]|uniref:alpha-L-fucosidase n=1 Tax=Microbacterium sp. NPDC090281 TaxID=3364208 RepID=UPI003806547C